MRDYANFVVLGALCALGCSNAETPATTQSGAMTGAGTTAPVMSTQPAATSGAGAGRVATAANGGSPATGTAGAPTSTPTATGGSSASGGAGASTTTASAGSSAAGTTAASGAGAAGMSSAAGSGGSGGMAGSGGAMDPTFTNVYTNILINMCPSCHMTGGVIGSPDLSNMEMAYTTLVGKDATTAMTGVCGGKGKLVTPGDCEKSLLYNKLSQATPLCGRRMPLSSMTVPQSGLDLLCAWIKAGAKNN